MYVPPWFNFAIVGTMLSMAAALAYKEFGFLGLIGLAALVGVEKQINRSTGERASILQDPIMVL